MSVVLRWEWFLVLLLSLPLSSICQQHLGTVAKTFSEVLLFLWPSPRVLPEQVCREGGHQLQNVEYFLVQIDWFRIDLERFLSHLYLGQYFSWNHHKLVKEQHLWKCKPKITNEKYVYGLLWFPLKSLGFWLPLILLQSFKPTSRPLYFEML